MDAIVRLPILWLTFWFYFGPKGIIEYFISFNKSFLQLSSLPLFIRTFFKPWKNEYRKGLVGFSRGIGMFLKSIFICVDLLIFAVLVIFEVAVVTAFVLWPFATFYLLFVKL